MATEAPSWAPGGAWGHLTLRRDLGPGPRGLVYRAWDPALGREVILAIAPDVHTDPAGRDTLRDARALMRVHDPSLAAVYGAERRTGRVGIWMELVDGDTLETVLAHAGRFSAREAALIGIDICAALTAMHQAGVLHRDLDTRQILRDRNGRTVVVPFGAGRDTAPGAAGAVTPPAAAPPGAARGAESAQGSACGVEHDLYLIGAVLHRLVAGPAVAPAGGSALRPLADLRSDLPLGFVRGVERALSADPAQRYASAADLSAALATLWTPMSPRADPAAQSGRRGRVLTVATMAAAVLAVGVFLGAWRSRQPPPSEVRFVVHPEGSEIESVALSRDGQRLAYAAGGRLRLRSLNEDVSAALEPSLGVRNPFFSSDGQWVHFFAGSSLWRVRAAGGAPQFVAPARRPSTGGGGPDGSIVYSVENGSSLMLLPPVGPPRVLRTQVPGARMVLRWPSLVGDGSHVLYSAIDARTGRRAVHLGSIDAAVDAPDLVLLELSSNAVAAGPHVFYVEAGALTVRRLDPRDGRFLGQPRVLARGVVTDPYGDGQIELSVSENGAVAYVGGARTTRTLRVLDATGRPVIDLASGDVRDLRVAPDGQRIAYEQVDASTGGRDVWVVDIHAGPPIRISRHPAHDIAPTWAPDGRRLYFLSQRGPLPTLISTSANGDAAEHVHFTFDASAIPYAITRDGSALLYEQEGQETGWDIWLRPLSGGAPTPLVRGRANEQEPSLSPDGGWLAYSSPESEGRQVYLERVPSNGQRWRVSDEHGRQPQWTADGAALFYHGSAHQLIRREIRVRDGAPVLGAEQALFAIPLRGYDMRYQYGLLPDGGRVVVNVPPALAPPVPATVILNAPLP